MDDQTSRVGCDCVISGGEWHPCYTHDLALVVAEATGTAELDRIPLADAGYSLLRMPGSATRHPGAWHRTDTHMTVTPRGKSPDHASRAVTYSIPDVVQQWPSAPGALRVIGGAFVRLDEPRFPRLAELTARAVLDELRAARVAAKLAKRAGRAHHDAEATTRATRAAQRATGKPRRTAAQVAALHNSAHDERQEVDTARLARLAQALAVVGDSWADRKG